MHELSLAAEAYRLCREALRQDPAAGGEAKLEQVTLAVGELAAVDPDQLTTAWASVVSGSQDAGCVLTIEWKSAHQVCHQCGHAPAHAPGNWLTTCPRCGHPLGVEGGNELDILRLRYTHPHADA